MPVLLLTEAGLGLVASHEGCVYDTRDRMRVCSRLGPQSPGL